MSPIYVYKCFNCDVQYDVLHSVNDCEKYYCTDCSAELVKIPTSFTVAGATGAGTREIIKQEKQKAVKAKKGM